MLKMFNLSSKFTQPYALIGSIVGITIGRRLFKYEL